MAVNLLNIRSAGLGESAILTLRRAIHATGREGERATPIGRTPSSR